MNTSSHFKQQPISLKEAVQEQLDLILKLEEDRKVLKKENKLLTKKLSALNQIAIKYEKQTAQVSVNTEHPQEQSTKPSFIEAGVQIQIENKLNISNISKLSQAKQLLKEFQASQDKECTKVQKQFSKQQKSKTSNRQISDEIVKMSKEMNKLRRQLNDSDHKLKTKQKQIKQLKKCMQNKNEALEKARKDFNELSNILNTDKYKSIRSLQNQIVSLKQKLESQSHLQKTRKFLEQLTLEYQNYKQQAEHKIIILVDELASKQKENEALILEYKKLKQSVH